MLYSARNNPYNVILNNVTEDSLQLDIYDNSYSNINNFNYTQITGFNSTIYTITKQSDGKILVGGNFTTYNNVTSNYIVRLNSDYTIDTGFTIGSGFNSAVNIIKVQSDGKILVGGNFSSYNGTSVAKFVRLNSNGTIDNSVSQFGFGNSVNTIAIQSDGKILVGGNFLSYSGITQNYITRLNTNLSYDNTFTIGSGFNNTVLDIDIQSDNKILVCGYFTQYSGIIKNYITRLNTNGTIDSSFNIGSGFNDATFNIKIQSDGKILVGGSFTSYSGITSNKIARLNSNGTKDSSFNIGSGFDYIVLDIDIVNDKILINGMFSTYSGVTANKSILLNSTGSVYKTYNDILTQSPNETISSSYVDGNYILIGQRFSLTNNSFLEFDYLNNKVLNYNPPVKLIEIDNNLLFESYNNNGFNSGAEILVIKKQPDGKILIAGYFTSYNGFNFNNIVRLNSDYTIDTGFTIGTGFNGEVYDLKIQSDGKIIVGGGFTSYNGVTQNRITRLNTDGTRDTGFIIGAGFNSSVNTIQIQSDNRILVGGLFTQYSGVTQNYITKLDSNGYRTAGFIASNAGFNDRVKTIFLQSDGKILCGGEFTTYSGVTQNYITRLNTDGTRDSSFNIGTGFNNYVSIIRKDDYNIIIGGLFTQYSGYTINTGYVCLNLDGSLKNPTSYQYSIQEVGFPQFISFIYPINEYENLIKYIVTKTYAGSDFNYISFLYPDLNTYTEYKLDNIFYKGSSNSVVLEKINSYKYITTSNANDFVNKRRKLVYSGNVYKRPDDTTNMLYVDIQPLIKDMIDEINFPQIRDIYFEFSNGYSETIKLNNIMADKYKSNQINEFSNVFRLYDYDSDIVNLNYYYAPDKPLNKFVKYSTNSNRLFNRLIYNDYYSTNSRLEYALYETIYSLYIISLYTTSNFTIRYYNYFNNQNDTLVFNHDVKIPFGVFQQFNNFNLINNSELQYNGEKYGAIEFIVDDKSFLYFMEFVCDENDEQLMLFWLNKNNTYDYCAMNKKLVKSIKTSRNQFETNKYYLSGYHLVEERYTTNNYLNESDVLFDLNSDLLSDILYKEIADIIDSPKIFVAFVDNGVLNVKQALIEGDTFTFKRYKNDQMFNFSVRVRLSEKEIRY